MRQAKLSLEHAFFTRIRLDAAAVMRPQQPPGMSTINVTCDVKKHHEDPTRFLVQMTVAIRSKDEKASGLYEGELTAFGGIKVADDVPANERATLVVVNGKSILYGVIREMVANLSARSPHGTYLLPTVTFCDEAAKPAEVSANTGKKAKKRQGTGK